MSQFIRLTTVNGNPILLNKAEIKEVYIGTINSPEYVKAANLRQKTIDDVIKAGGTMKIPPEVEVQTERVTFVVAGVGRDRDTWYVKESVDEVQTKLERD